MADPDLNDKDLTVFENIACAWPLIFVVLGGAIGGALGALAWVVNKKVMRRYHRAIVKYPAIIIVGLLAFAVYLFVAAWVVLLLPGLYAR